MLALIYITISAFYQALFLFVKNRGDMINIRTQISTNEIKERKK